MERSKYERDEEAVWGQLYDAVQRNKEEYPCHKCRYYKLCQEGENCYVDYLREKGQRAPLRKSKKWGYIRKVLQDMRGEEKNVQTI